MLKRIAVGVSLVGVLALAGTAFAGNGVGPNKSSSSSISPPVVVSSGTASPTTATSGPHYGDTITFTVSTTETAYPFVNLKCYQNKELVGEGWAGFFAGALGNGTFGLYGGSWGGGAADCTASLEMYSNGKWKQLASTSFHVDA